MVKASGTTELPLRRPAHDRERGCEQAGGAGLRGDDGEALLLGQRQNLLGGFNQRGSEHASLRIVARACGLTAMHHLNCRHLTGHFGLMVDHERWIAERASNSVSPSPLWGGSPSEARRGGGRCDEPRRRRWQETLTPTPPAVASLRSRLRATLPTRGRVAPSLLLRHRHYRQNSISRMMIGIGTPNSQSSAPFPSPIVASIGGSC